MQGIAESHRILSNLLVNLKQLGDSEQQARFTAAVGYEYVKMCPAVYFLQLFKPDNPTRFTIDCVGKSQELFSAAVGIAGKSMKGAPAADIYFIAGIGMDRLKANMSNVPGANLDGFLKRAREYVGKAASQGTSFGGVETILARLDKDEYRKTPVVDDSKFRDLSRTLILGNIVPVIDADTAEMKSVPESSKITPDVADENTYLDYKWRFSIRRPDETWMFVSERAGTALHLSIKKKNSSDQRGSGLNLICSPLKPEDSGAPLNKIVEKSVELLKSAGYSDLEGKNVSFSGIPAYELKSAHKYNELIPSEDTMEEAMLTGDSSTNMASRQYMIIAIANGMQYILSFSSLDTEYPRIFPIYRAIAETFSVF